MMATASIEDLYGTVEIIVFPQTYEKKKHLLVEGSKVFVKGRAQTEDNKAGKVICQDIIPFDRIPCELWIRFANKEAYLAVEKKLLQQVVSEDGTDTICIYLEQEHQVKKLPRSYGDECTKNWWLKVHWKNMEKNLWRLKKRVLKNS